MGVGMGRRVERKLLMNPGAALDTRGAGPSPWGVTREKGEGQRSSPLGLVRRRHSPDFRGQTRSRVRQMDVESTKEVKADMHHYGSAHG